MRTLLLITLVGCVSGSKNDLQDPSDPFHAVSGYATLEQVKGHLEGTRADPITGMPAPAGVPYTEREYDVGAAIEFWPQEPTMLGTNVGMLAGMHFSYLGGGTIDGMAADSGFLPLDMGVSWGTALQLVRRSGLLLTVHSSLNLDYSPDRLGDTAESMLVVYGGLRGYYETGPVRTRLQYDFMPFWSGESRLEHRITGLISTRPNDGWGYGVRLGLEVGQKRLDAGGLNDIAFTVGLEVQ